jgi:DNA primase catalytic subunit
MAWSEEMGKKPYAAADEEPLDLDDEEREELEDYASGIDKSNAPSRRAGKKEYAAQPSAGISAAKAKKVLKDGEVRGHPLTEKQRGMFGAAAGKGEK